MADMYLHLYSSRTSRTN